jgi:hypothetical protein
MVDDIAAVPQSATRSPSMRDRRRSIVQIGDRTCECIGRPVCRHHHRCKQAPGWLLEQPEPGIFRWAGPSGRTRTTYPTRYLL